MKMIYSVILSMILSFLILHSSESFARNENYSIGMGDSTSKSNSISFLINDKMNLSYKKILTSNWAWSISLILSHRYTDEEIDWQNDDPERRIINNSTFGLRTQMLYELLNNKNLNLIIGLGPAILNNYTYDERKNIKTGEGGDDESSSMFYAMSVLIEIEILVIKDLYLNANYELQGGYLENINSRGQRYIWKLQLNKMMIGAAFYF